MCENISFVLPSCEPVRHDAPMTGEQWKYGLSLQDGVALPLAGSTKRSDT